MKKYLAFVAVIFLLSFSLIACNSESRSNNSSSQSLQNNQVINKELRSSQQPQLYNPLTGLKVRKRIVPVAVMVDNNPSALPQKGLSRADIVYEMETEGLITRFMAIFYGDPPRSVGPVRSARPYFLAVAKEWDVYYAHVGGSNDALVKIDQWNISSLNDMRGFPGFFVDPNRRRPHSTFLDLNKALEGKKEKGNLKNWSFSSSPPDIIEYKKISFPYRYNKPEYIWSSEEDCYLRYINSKPHVDAETGEQIRVKNIIVQYADHRYLGNKLGHIDIDLIGTGKAEYFLGGKYETGSWKKDSLYSPTVFYNDAGKRIELARGNTWIQVVSNRDQISKAPLR